MRPRGPASGARETCQPSPSAATCRAGAASPSGTSVLRASPASERAADWSVAAELARRAPAPNSKSEIKFRALFGVEFVQFLVVFVTARVPTKSPTPIPFSTIHVTMGLIVATARPGRPIRF